MLLKIFISILLLGVGAVYAAYLAANRETMTAETFRDGSGYQTATLSHGTTAFRTHGAVGAPVPRREWAADLRATATGLPRWRFGAGDEGQLGRAGEPPRHQMRCIRPG